MRLIENWKSAPKMASVAIASLGATIAGIWMLLPEATQLQVLEQLGVRGIAATIMVTFLSVIGARLVKQEAVSGPSQ